MKSRLTIGRSLPVVLALCTTSAGAAGTEATPRAVVEEVTGDAIKVLGQSDLSADAKRARLEQIVYAHVDFDTLSRLVLGPNWARFADDQKTKFVEEFKRHLSMTYGRNVESYHNEQVAISGERNEPRGDHTVMTKIARGRDAILVDYRLRQTNGRWQIIDFIIEGVSLVANYRAQFQDMLSHGSPDDLLKILHEKNERGELLKAPRSDVTPTARRRA